MENIEKEKSVFGFYMEEYQQGRRLMIEDVVRNQINTFHLYLADKIKQTESLSPVSKKKIQIKLRSSTIVENAMKLFEPDIKEMEKLDENVFRIPSDLNLTPLPKCTKEELEELDKTTKELNIRYKQSQLFIHLLEKELLKMEKVQKSIENEQEIFEKAAELGKCGDVSEIENLHKEVFEKKFESLN